MQVADASRFDAHGQRMTRLTIRTVNSQFATETMLDQIETAEQAQAIGVSGAIAMLAEEVAKGYRRQPSPSGLMMATMRFPTRPYR